MQQKEFKTILFDMDGVVIDSEKLHLKAMGLTLEQHDIPYSHPFLTEYVGRSDESFFTYVFDNIDSSFEVEKLLDIKNTLFEGLLAELEYVEGFIEFINKVDKNADRGGLIGIFFMAFTLALVSFSCTGPIIGPLLVEAAYVGGTSGPLVGMFGFSLALALPFGLFAAFPGWMNSLPQSGGWLNSVKVVLGFLELALAFKFLSNADLVLQLGILTREVFIAIWIGVFLIMAFYLFGAFRLPHDSKIEKLSVGRMLFGTLTVIFVIYLIPGMWGAPLKIISGFPPPSHYSESPSGVGGGGDLQSDGVIPAEAHASVHGLMAFHDYEPGLAYAKKVNKPVLLDFTGHACVNCRKMEAQVWSEPEVLSRLKNEVVLISLYVDDKRDLPENEKVEVTIGTKTRTLKTIGNKWSHFQASRYKSNSQPLYVLMDHNEENLVEPTAYDLDVENYVKWLDAGIKAFKGQSAN